MTQRAQDIAAKVEAFVRETIIPYEKDPRFEVHGHGREGGIQLTWRGSTYTMDLIPKIQINIVLSDHNVDRTVETICRAARTGEKGDGLIFIYPVEDVVRVRTGERGRDALTYEGDIDAVGGAD